MKIVLKKSCYFWLNSLLCLLFTHCGTLHQAPYPTDDALPPPPPPPPICIFLELKVLEISEKKDSKVTVSYEIKNTTHTELSKLYHHCKILFLIQTKQGTQIAHTEDMYGSIPAKTSVIKEAEILLASYDVEEIEIKTISKN